MLLIKKPLLVSRSLLSYEVHIQEPGYFNTFTFFNAALLPSASLTQVPLLNTPLAATFLPRYMSNVPGCML